MSCEFAPWHPPRLSGRRHTPNFLVTILVPCPIKARHQWKSIFGIILPTQTFPLTSVKCAARNMAAVTGKKCPPLALGPLALGSLTLSGCLPQVPFLSKMQLVHLDHQASVSIDLLPAESVAAPWMNRSTAVLPVMATDGASVQAITQTHHCFPTRFHLLGSIVCQRLTAWRFAHA